MIYTLGESLIDIIFESKDDIVSKPGGGMLNTAVSLGRSGVEAALISEVGDDETAGIIIDFLKDNSVESKYIKKYYHQKTSIALAFLNEQKVPSFSIYKSYPDKRRLIFPDEFTPDDILVFGSLYSISPEIRNDVLHVLASAKSGEATLCYDPNIRHHNLDDHQLKQAFEENVNFADIVKGSDDDFKNIFGTGVAEDYYAEIKRLNPEVVFIFTKGADGVSGFYQDKRIDLPAIKTEVVSTIGAGDAFNAGISFFLNKRKGGEIKDKRGMIKDERGKIKDKRGKMKELKEEEFAEMLNSGLKYSAAVCATMDNYVPSNFS